MMYEYGKHKVKNSYSSKSDYYTVKLKTEDGHIETMAGQIKSGGDRLYMWRDSQKDYVLNALKLNQKLSFYIVDQQYFTDEYWFTIENSSYFDSAYNFLLNK